MAQTPAFSTRANLGLFVVLLIMAWCSTQLILTLREHQHLTQDRAELKHVKYGLLNADNWVTQVTDIVEAKVRNLELTGQNRELLQRSLERMLDVLITEADKYMREQNRRGNVLKRITGKFKEAVADEFVDLNTVKAGIPRYAEQILLELEKPDAREELGDFLEQIVRDLSKSTFGEVDYALLDAIHARYGCDSKQACVDAINGRIAAMQPLIIRLSTAVLSLAMLMFYIAIAKRREPDSTRLGLLVLCCFLLMLCGVLTPMIEVEARISELKFVLLGETVAFRDEIFYFQSKSVLDVVSILVRTGAYDMMIVGVLIMTFSVIFPLAKLLASFIYLHDWRGLRNGMLTKFFALKSGKWSMADVMVVAIMMAYIGFNGLISSQLTAFEKDTASTGVDVLTTNGTALQIGFFMFLAFCMASLVTSTLIEAAIKSVGSEPARD